MVVSIMPCTAKKFEAKRPEFETDGRARCRPRPHHPGTGVHDRGGRAPFQGPGARNHSICLSASRQGQASSSAIRAVSGGGPAVCHRAVDGRETRYLRIHERTGEAGIREATLKVTGKEFTLAVVSGLGNARKVLEDIKTGEAQYDLVEVMACPGGCIGGAGQPVFTDPRRADRSGPKASTKTTGCWNSTNPRKTPM